MPGQKISYQVTKQKLTLNKSNYKIGDTIIGYVDAEFIETVSVPKKGTKQHKFYLKGYVRTQLKRQTQYGGSRRRIDANLCIRNFRLN